MSTIFLSPRGAAARTMIPDQQRLEREEAAVRGGKRGDDGEVSILTRLGMGSARLGTMPSSRVWRQPSADFGWTAPRSTWLSLRQRDPQSILLLGASCKTPFFAVQIRIGARTDGNQRANLVLFCKSLLVLPSRWATDGQIR